MSAPLPSHPPADDLQALRERLALRARTLVATVEHASGRVWIEDPLCERPRLAATGDRLSREVTLHVEQGRALVRLDDGSDVWLDAGSRLELSSWRDAARRLKLKAGRMLALVAQDIARPFEALAGSARVVVTGTAFEASVSEREGVRVDVLHGAIRLGAGGREVAVRDGQRAQALGDKMTVTRRPKDAGTPSWAGGLGLSASNPRIAPAYRGVTKALQPRTPKPSDERTQGMSSTIKNGALILAALALVGGGAWWFQGGQEPDPGKLDAAMSAGAGDTAGQGPGGGPGQPVMDRDFRIKLRMPDGSEQEFTSLEAAMAALGPEEGAKLKERLGGEGSWTADGNRIRLRDLPGGGKGGPNDIVPHDAIVRDAQAAMETMQALIASGMSPEEARQVVEASIGDSLRKQANDPDADIKVHMMPMGTDGGKVGVFITKEVGDGTVEATADEEVIN